MSRYPLWKMCLGIAASTVAPAVVLLPLMMLFISAVHPGVVVSGFIGMATGVISIVVGQGTFYWWLGRR